MKTLKNFLPLLLSSMSMMALAQNLSTRSHDFEIDTADGKKMKESSVPIIIWESPLNETVFHRDEKLLIKMEISSPVEIKEIHISIRPKDQPEMRGGTTFVKPKEHEKNKLVLEKSMTVPTGVNVLEVIVENIDGVKSKSQRTIHAGETALSNAAKLSRNDYALLILTDKYDNWTPLVNPVFDGRSIATHLQKSYGFHVEVLENPSQDLIFRKLREYSEKKYEPLDQLLIFFAGHGYFDETFKEGFAVVKESLKDDPGKTSYVSYNRLRNVINTIPCEHVLLMMDVCFGGTFDEAIASSRQADVYQEISQSDFIIRKLAVKTRKYLTSGGKTYVSDGIPGKHSPFAKRVIDAMNTLGGNDGILTLTELWPYVEKLNPEPRLGKFGDDAPGSEFVFVVK
jgi:hypothetical protein